MRVHAVEGRVGRMRLVEVTEQVVDEMRQGFGSDHRFRRTAGTQIRQWYNKRSIPAHMPGTLFVVATPIGNLEDITVAGAARAARGRADRRRRHAPHG